MPRPPEPRLTSKRSHWLGVSEEAVDPNAPRRDLLEIPYLQGGELAHRREAWVFIISRGGRGHSPRVARRPLLAPLGPPRAPPRRRALPKRTTPLVEWSVTLRQLSARERANPPAPEESKSRAHTLDAHDLLSIDPPTVPLRQGREIPPSARIGQWLARLVVVVSACPPLE